MKNLVIDKTSKQEVELYRKRLNGKSYKKERLFEIYGEFRINSSPDFKEIYKCWECGLDITYYDEPNERIYCSKCRKEHQSEIVRLQREQTRIKNKLMLEKAMCIIEESKSYAHEYYETYKYLIKDIEENPTKYKSSEEIVVALVLYNYNYQFEANKKIDKYYVDFYIPECKVCLEVDGDRHKYNAEYDKNRDLVIRKILGSDWEIVRIPTKYIVQYPDKVVDAMYELKDKMKSERNKYGIIPDNFSNREKEYYSNILDNNKDTKEDENYKLIRDFFEKKKKN